MKGSLKLNPTQPPLASGGGGRTSLVTVLLTVAILVLCVSNYALVSTNKYVSNGCIDLPSADSPSIKIPSANISSTNVTTVESTASVETAKEEIQRSSKNATRTCPDYFKYIFDDLAPWKRLGGISLKAVEDAAEHASMRIQILNGKLYVREFYVCFQSRTVFTVWGILQLLRRYPNDIPDVDFMLECEDFSNNLKAYLNFLPDPPLLFRYCTTERHQEPVFPDFSFWGWPEISIPGWDTVRNLVSNNTGGDPWESRIPLGQWKGAIGTADIRKQAFQCNDPDHKQWSVEILDINWETELESKSSRLENQCTHRYKIYMEGRSWSCSLKYILACASTVFLVQNPHYDFYSRALQPFVHYVPIEVERPICESFQDAVAWGERNPEKAKEIGRAGSAIVNEEMNMERVYEYMYHLLHYYHSLQTFTPTRVTDSVYLTIASVLRDHPDELRSYFGPKEKPAKEKPCELVY